MSVKLRLKNCLFYGSQTVICVPAGLACGMGPMLVLWVPCLRYGSLACGMGPMLVLCVPFLCYGFHACVMGPMLVLWVPYLCYGSHSCVMGPWLVLWVRNCVIVPWLVYGSHACVVLFHACVMGPILVLWVPGLCYEYHTVTNKEYKQLEESWQLLAGPLGPILGRYC